MNDKEVKQSISYIKQLAKSIIMECNKWSKHPSAVFHHGYAKEKALKLLDELNNGQEKYPY